MAFPNEHFQRFLDDQEAAARAYHRDFEEALPGTHHEAWLAARAACFLGNPGPFPTLSIANRNEVHICRGRWVGLGKQRNALNLFQLILDDYPPQFGDTMRLKTSPTKKIRRDFDFKRRSCTKKPGRSKKTPGRKSRRKQAEEDTRQVAFQQRMERQALAKNLWWHRHRRK